MVTLVFLIAAVSVISALAAATFRGGNVMRAEGDGGSGSGNDDLGWGSGDIDVPF